MRFVAVFLVGCAAGSSQPFAILPPSLNASDQTVFFGSTLYPGGPQYAADIYAQDSRGIRPLTHIGVDSNSIVVEFAVSSDGSQLAYTAELGITSVLRSVNLNSGESKTWTCIFQLCTSSDASLHIGPDNRIIISGHRIAHFSADIYSANTDGSFTFLSDGYLAPSPQRAISETGLIVFTQYQSLPANVYVMNLDGTNKRALTHFPVPAQGVNAGKVARDATISQSGALVVFATTDAALENRSQIWAVTSDGLLRSLSGPDEDCASPSLSSDGTLAAFVCNGQVNILRTDGTARLALTNFRWSAASSPVMSADGSRVVFTLGPPGNGLPVARGAIWSIGTDGKRLEPLYAPHVLNPGGIIDSFGREGPAPIGDLITAFGANFTTDSLSVAAERPLPDSLNGISLLVNGRAVPILSVTPWQINAQLPSWVPEGSATFQIHFEDASASNLMSQAVVPSGPRLIGLGGNRPNCQLAVLHAGTGVLADQQHPATVGETVEIYALSLGPTDPMIPAGVPGPKSPPAKLIAPLTVILGDNSGGFNVPVLFAGLAPGLIGIYQINGTIPAGSSGRREVFLQAKYTPGDTGGCSFWVR
jgi:uncharacterized protein (TIGR03437 family)